MALLKSSFYPRKTPVRFGPILSLQFNDSLYLQFVLADRAVVLFAGLFREDDSSRRLPREIRTAPGNVRRQIARAPLKAKIDMVACGKRGRSKYRVETGKRIARAGTRFALRFDHNHHNRFRSGKQERSALDRSSIHTAGLLADHAPRILRDQADPHPTGRSRSLAKPRCICARMPNSHDTGECALVAEVREKVSLVP